MNKILLIVLVIFVIGVGYWQAVMTAANDYMHEGNEKMDDAVLIGLKELNAIIQGNKDEATNFHRQRDSVKAVAKYLYTKSDNTIKLIPECLRP